MCVKEFLGFICGHCSVPTLRRCPSSLANSYFLPCTVPAERAIYMANYCHPCARADWNANDTREQEVHKGEHERGECECSTVFSQEERERRFGTAAQQPRYGRDQWKVAEQIAEREQIANTQMHRPSNFYQQFDGSGRSSIVEVTANGPYADHVHTPPQYQPKEGNGTGEHQHIQQQQQRDRQNHHYRHAPSYSQDSVLTSDAHRYHHYSLPTTPYQTPSRPMLPFHDTLLRSQLVNERAIAVDAMALPTESSRPEHLVPVTPVQQHQHLLMMQQQQQQQQQRQQEYQFQLMIYNQQSHGFRWYHEAPNQGVPTFPTQLQTPQNRSISRPAAPQSMKDIATIPNSVLGRNQSRQVSPRTVPDTVSEVIPCERNSRKNSGSKRGRQGKPSKKNKKRSASASAPLDRRTGGSATPRRHS